MILGKFRFLRVSAGIAECWENVYKATDKRDTVLAISAQLSGFVATMSASTCRS